MQSSSNVKAEIAAASFQQTTDAWTEVFPELLISLHETVSNNWNAPSPAQWLTSVFFPKAVQLTPAQAVVDWVQTVQKLCAQGKEEEALKRIATEAAKAKTSQEYKKLSNELAQVNLSQLPNAVLVALVRNTFSIRAEIPTWETLLDSVSQTLARRGKEPRVLLRGLKRA
jgi:hypothetical protein